MSDIQQTRFSLGCFRDSFVAVYLKLDGWLRMYCDVKLGVGKREGSYNGVEFFWGEYVTNEATLSSPRGYSIPEARILL